MIDEPDAPALAKLLAKGFPERTIDYWSHALEALARRDAPAGYPRFGYLLEHEGAPVGVILMIFTQLGADKIRCNISSWYVEEAYRGYASLLIAAAVRHRDVTYINTSPAPHTWRVIEAQGFRRYCNGQMLTIPALSRWAANARVKPFDALRDYGDSLSSQERALLTAHAERGCLALIVHEKRDAHPFVFLPRRVLKGLVPTQQLIYCRNLADFQRFAGPLGRDLLRRGHPTVLLDATEKIPGLFGIYLPDRGPKYFKGPERPRLGDLAFCESVIFGP
ncbi:GNAT family N-acetyltransferase [Methylocystis sp. MJC1]|jgi:hypothetical protein|uniref:GNAT family N-acetyltransferase n=1 Tax=Methylocystis sp. MJC1 TaxID=2654282 RepID=UPI001FEDD199|nr:GNAT family N-acetyltransferase [Methylocystis sp. MJC1]UZX13087.1 GNAT family N-acetyltransferase [Methylocystis sp. MJC1]